MIERLKAIDLMEKQLMQKRDELQKEKDDAVFSIIGRTVKGATTMFVNTDWEFVPSHCDLVGVVKIKDSIISGKIEKENDQVTVISYSVGLSKTYVVFDNQRKIK